MAKTDHPSRWATRRDVAAFVVLVATAGFTGMQWREMRRALLVDQRAWVSVVGPPNFPLDSASIPASIQITNTGKTPGKQLDADVIATALKKGEEPSFDFGKGHPHDRIHAGAIFPNTPFNITVPVVRYGPQAKQTIVPTAEFRQELANGESFIIFYGRISYVDIFGTAHWTSFCTWSGSAVGNLKKCVSYNDVDTN